MQRLPSLFTLIAILVTASFASATDHKDKSKDKKDDHRPAAKKPEPRHDDHRHPPTKRGPAPTRPAYPWIHGHGPSSRCACDRGAPYKIQDCRPALTAKGTINFIRIFEAAAARGVENATIRAMNAASVAPTNNGQPCADTAKPSPAPHPPRGR